MPSDPLLCPHDQIAGRCWLCLTDDEQRASQEVWKQLESMPGFAEAIERSRQEISDGKVIRLKRKTASGREIVMPHSVFREVVEMLHEDKARRGESE